MIYYVTYIQNGQKKSATVKESRYRQLANDPTITNLQTYSNSQQLREATGGTVRKILHG